MAINFVQTRDGSDDSIRLQPMERLKVYLFGATVLFASFGMGEAVYRLLFSEFDGATDRIPVEVLFGSVFAWLATKFVCGVYRNRKERSARLNFIWARNHQIRGAVEGITPVAHPVKNQQSIRIIREEVDRIEWALKEILPVLSFSGKLQLESQPVIGPRTSPSRITMRCSEPPFLNCALRIAVLWVAIFLI